jgi:hypothetical protein
VPLLGAGTRREVTVRSINNTATVSKAICYTDKRIYTTANSNIIMG